MRYPVQQEQELVERALSFAHDPVAFAHFMYPWGEAGTPLANVSGLRIWQGDALEALAEHTRSQGFALDNSLPLKVFRRAWSSGRGPGKSALFAIAAHWHLSTHLGAQTIVTANTEAQLRTKTFAEISRWITMSANSHWFNIEGIKVEIADWFADMIDQQLKIDRKYWTIQGQTWTAENPDAFAGSHNPYGLMLLFDEAAGIPAGIWDTADGFFSDPTPFRYHMAASQMRRASGRFYDLFFDAARSKLWTGSQMMSTVGMEGVDQAWVKDFIEVNGEDSDAVAVEIHGRPPNMGENQFIATSLVTAAQSRMIPCGPGTYVDYGEPLIMGVDPAPRGRTVIRFRQGRNARDCCGSDTVTVMHNADNPSIANMVAHLNRKYSPDAICIDFGAGTGVIDICKHTHKLRVVEVRFGETPQGITVSGERGEKKKSEWASRGAELWSMVRDWLPGAMIDSSAALFRDLTRREWRWSGREDGKKKMEDKEEMRARGLPSPDDADALAITFASNPPRRDARTARGGRQTQSEGTTETLM